LEEDEKQNSKTFKLFSMETYIVESAIRTPGVGFEGHWLGNGGEERCSVVEERSARLYGRRLE